MLDPAALAPKDRASRPCTFALASGGYHRGYPDFNAAFGTDVTQRAFPTPEMGIFTAAFLTGVTINAALVRPYFRVGTAVKLALAGLGVGLLLMAQMVAPHWDGGGPYFFAAMVMLALTSTMFVRQIDRALAKQQGLERAMA